ncbi:hypothetical protein [Streptomyces kanamyceticus]|nr:hypothetical protein [Streptomyces kanamyceticus]
MTTPLSVDGDRLTVGPETDCLCHCPQEEESEALQTARAAARARTDPQIPRAGVPE